MKGHLLNASRGWRCCGEMKFTLFPSLPVELRLKIWSFVETPYNEPRVHSIRGFPYTLLDSKQEAASKVLENNPKIWKITRFEFEPDRFDRVVFLSPHAIHPILHACQQSRYYALKTFDLTFEFETYVNFSRDIIFLDSSKGISHEEDCEPGLQSAYELSQRTMASPR